MFRTILVFLASPQDPARSELALEKPLPSMATRAKSFAPANRAKVRYEATTAGPSEGSNKDIVILLTVVGNAFGFSLLMSGLWLVLRLAETLLA